MPAKDIIMLVGLPPRKFSSFLYPVKDDVGLKTTGALLAHSTWHPNKSTVAEHIFNNHNHHIHFLETKIFSTKSGYLDLPHQGGN